MKIYNFPDILKGDTFKSRDITIKNETTQVPLDLTGVLIKSEFRQGNKIGLVIETLEVGNGITVNNPLTGTFTIENFNVDWDSDIYYYDFQFTFLDGSVQTYFGGYMKVIQDVTQN